LARVTYNLEWAVPLVVDEQGEVVREAAFRLQVEQGVNSGEKFPSFSGEKFPTPVGY